jgi:hypothetical protein
MKLLQRLLLLALPLETIQAQIAEVKHHHIPWSDKPERPAYTNLDDCSYCAYRWPCDAIRLAEKLELAVEALDLIEGEGDYHDKAEQAKAAAATSRLMAGNALSRIADLVEKEGETR